MSRDVTQQNEVELRERRNMAGGLSAFERQAAMTDVSATIYERMALEGSRASASSNSMSSLSANLNMPPSPGLSSNMGASLPGLMPNRDSMLGVLGPQVSRPEISMFQQVSMPPISAGQTQASPTSSNINASHSNSFASILNDSGGAFSPSFKGGGDTFSALSTPPAKAVESTLNPLAPGPETGPFQHSPAPPPTSTRNEASPEKPGMLENMASGLGQVNPGNLLQDVKRSMNPILQFAKEVFQLVTGSLFAFLNFFFKPPVK